MGDREEYGTREYHYRYSTDAGEYSVGHHQFRTRVRRPHRRGLPSLGCAFMTVSTCVGDRLGMDGLMLPCTWCYCGGEGEEYYLTCQRSLRELIQSHYPAIITDAYVDTLTDLLESANATHCCRFRPGVESTTFHHLRIQVRPFLTQESLDNMEAPLSTATATRRIEEEECSICMDAMTTTETLTMPCSHTFHRPCLGRWLNTNHSCPICRYQLPTH